MKLIAVLITLCLLTGTAAAITLPQVVSFPQSAVTGVKPVATFEGGQRFAAGDYPVIVLSGSYRQMGRQYGSLMKNELNEEYTFLLDTLAKRGYTREQVRETGRDITAFYPQRIKELFNGMSETSGLTPDDIAVLYYGAIFQLMATPPVPASCSYLAAWGNYTTDGSVIVSRNWDLDDTVLPYTKWYVLAVYRPTDGSNSIATWSPAGMRPETFMNSKGLFIADDNSGLGDAAPETRPEFITEFFRFMF
ncbi:MAG: C45 family peptidase, partial [Methanoregula sp.]|nr:C45 family peptidase [Methanoregula sp.]